MKTEKRYFQIEADLPIGYPEEKLRYSIYVDKNLKVIDCVTTNK